MKKVVVLMFDNVEELEAIAPIDFLIISSFKKMSLLPTAFIACKLHECTGVNARAKQYICRYGTAGSHLSVKSMRISGVATAASPIIIGKIT